jgi:hypothetical protein
MIMKSLFAIKLLIVIALLLAPEVAVAQRTGKSATQDETVSQAVMRVLDQYMMTFNQMDVAAWEQTFQFPHYRLAGGQMKVLNEPGEQDKAVMKTRFAEMGWHHSAWQHRKIVHASDTKAHVDTKFTRYREDGTEIATFDSLYIFTKQGGRWGVKMRSSFAR